MDSSTFSLLIINSSEIINWADLIVSHISSVLVEAFIKEKNVLFLEYIVKDKNKTPWPLIDKEYDWEDQRWKEYYHLEDHSFYIKINSLNHLIEEIVSHTNSTLIRSKVGSVEVSRKMVVENALLGFEENGGFMYGKHNHVRDGGMALALALELLSCSNNTLSEELGILPPILLRLLLLRELS